MGKRNFTLVLQKNKIQTTTDQTHARKEHQNNTTITAPSLKQAINTLAKTLKKGDIIDTVWVMTEQRASDGFVWNNSKYTDPETIKKEVWQDPDHKEDIATLRKSIQSTSKLVFEACYGNEKTQKMLAGVFGISNVEYTPEYTWTSTENAKIYIREQKGLRGTRYIDIHSKDAVENKNLWKKVKAEPQPLKRPAVEPQWKPKKEVPIPPGGSLQLNVLPSYAMKTGSPWKVPLAQTQIKPVRAFQGQYPWQQLRTRTFQGTGPRTGTKIGGISGGWQPSKTSLSTESLMERSRKRREEESMRRRTAFEPKRPGTTIEQDIKMKYMPRPMPQSLRGTQATVCSKVFEGPIGGPYSLTQHSHEPIWIPYGSTSRSWKDALKGLRKG